MPDELLPHELAWLQEVERRMTQGESLDTREIMVALRDALPPGFQVSQISPRLLYRQGPSVEGLRAIGDRGQFVPDVERVIQFIQRRLIEYPSLAQVSAGEISEALEIPVTRAERLLALMGSLGDFFAGYTDSPDGYSSVSLTRDDVLAEYLRFHSVDEALARREQARMMHAPTPPPPSQEARPTASPVRNSVFILMNMDTQDDSLTDTCNTIKSECESFDLTAIRIDDVEHQDRITDRILEQITTSEFIIADLTGEKPNVYYEVGYAHALGKRPVLVRRRGTRLHFDLVVHNVPEYRNLTELKAILRKRLEAILGRVPRG